MTTTLRWSALLLGAVAFALAHTQALAWYSNQHQYLLHGLAARTPTLAHDWLANTLDPTPVFSAFVAAVPPLGLHAAYFALVMLYFVALMRLAAALPKPPPPVPFAFLLTLVHAGVGRYLSHVAFGVDLPWFLQCGVAGQYVLGPGLQPSEFGVLLVVGIAAFAHGRLGLTGACFAAACTVHATYLLPAAFLTLGIQIELLRERRRGAAVIFGLGLLAAVLPVVVYAHRTFGPTSPELFAEAQRILAYERIPHHAIVARWFDGFAAAQVAWVALGIALVWRTRLFPVLAVAFALSIAVTLIEAFDPEPGLALLFPWRVSAILVPVATAVILARAARPLGRVPVGVWVAGIAALAAAGVWVMATGRGYRASDGEWPLLEFVRRTGRANDVYLLPVATPKPNPDARGVFSASFAPPPRAAEGTPFIPADLQRFRLSTGHAVYVDFKAVPYKDVEVLEWRRRMRQCEAWYAMPVWDTKVRDELRRAGVTHVVAPAERDLAGNALEEVYADAHYRVYRVR